ncbi:MAG TPA: T9SS type A sorting domain-containing protein [Prolixibacteraceae bacterium]|nr:T9SS type A sorting domain-containing protein [Prolixibacteraceae bacterium]
MKKVFFVLFNLALCLGICNPANAQTISAPGTIFVPQDSIEFTYSTPSFSSTDWIGIYKVGTTPSADDPSLVWKYIPAESGTLKLHAPLEAGQYIAYLLCCDGYEIVATSAEFNIEIPSLETSFPVYVEGDSIVFSYVSPKFSATDKLAIYPSDVVPGPDTQALDSVYITAVSGTMSFKTALTDGLYTAYLLCCDGYDTLATASFEVMDEAQAFLTPKKMEFESGTSIDIYYNNPSFAAGDWVHIYLDGEIPGSNPITYGQIISRSGVVSFPGVLGEGVYYAVLFCCNSTTTEYARTDPFVVKAGSGGSYVKTTTAVYPANTSVFVNYKDEDRAAQDWLAVYKKGEIPGVAEFADWRYVTVDSSTVEFQPLPLGEYVVYLLCCDGYTIKARSEFKVVGFNTPSLVSTAFSYGQGEAIEFEYNDPNFEVGAGLDWIGIYHPDDIPANVRSMIWSYLTQANGLLSYSVPYENGTWPEDNPDTPLVPGEYVAYLFCCDAYTVYASTAFTITEFPTGADKLMKSDGMLSVYPNPTTGLVTIRLKGEGAMRKIILYNITGQVIYEDSPTGTVSQKMIDLKLDKGVYFLEVQTGKSRASQKLIIQ